jgi:hypothetical protein
VGQQFLVLMATDSSSTRDTFAIAIICETWQTDLRPDKHPHREVAMAEVQEKPRTPRPQTRAVRRSDVEPTRASHRGRGRRQPTEGVLADLDRMISALIKENRDLHRQIDKLSKLAVGAGSGIAERALRSLQRRISGTVDGGRKSGRRSAPRAPASRRRGKITDPELLERRRQALAKAREVRAAKRAGA